MATPTRILFIAGEVTPFADGSETAELVRTLPEQLQEVGSYDARIMMPRYGTISERKNSLHEVIRLSGTEIAMGEDTQMLTVKVASIPGLRLQVYFMDNDAYFKRKGTFAGEDGTAYEDNAERALFFGRAALETVKNLRWGPDVVHAFGWMGGLVPLLLRTEYADNGLFEDTRTVYTPDSLDAQARLTGAFAEAAGLSVGDGALDQSTVEAGLAHADAALYPPTMEPQAGADAFSADPEERAQQAAALYEQVQSEVPA